MLERSVYNWMFGVRFTLDGLRIKPCLPKQYENSIITLEYMSKKLMIQYKGYGNKVMSASINNEAVTIENGAIILDKLNESSKREIVLTVEM